MSKIELVVFDWAGTMVDYGSQAPMQVFARTFAKKGITLTKEEINAPMGMEKRHHIETLLKMERVSKCWEEQQGYSWTQADVDALYETFEEDLAQVVSKYAVAIPQVVETLDKLREMGIKIGSCTGYTSEMMTHVIPNAKSNGVYADIVITPDLVGGASRPEPFMIFEIMRKLGVSSVHNILKVGDTQVDIKEGYNAGVKTVGLLTGSNVLGFSKEEYDALSAEEQAIAKEQGKAKYAQAGADFVADTMADLLDIIAECNSSKEV